MFLTPSFISLNYGISESHWRSRCQAWGSTCSAECPAVSLHIGYCSPHCSQALKFIRRQCRASWGTQKHTRSDTKLSEAAPFHCIAEQLYMPFNFSHSSFQGVMSQPMWLKWVCIGYNSPRHVISTHICNAVSHVKVWSEVIFWKHLPWVSPFYYNLPFLIKAKYKM